MKHRKGALRLLLAVSATVAACGSRTGLLGLASDAGLDAAVPDAALPDAATCPAFPPIPATAPSSCTFSPTGSSMPILAAIAGQDLIALTPQATINELFHFGHSTGAILNRTVVSRGEYLGAMVVGFPSVTQLEVEFVLLRLDGSMLVHHQETFTVKDFGGMFGVNGNAAGTFAFGASMGDLGKVWVALAQGSLLGPFDDAALSYGGLTSPRVEPDERGRFLVLPVTTSSTADVYWLDPCAGTRTAAVLPKSGLAVGWGRELFGVSHAGQLETETADGTTALAHPLLDPQAQFWTFTAPFAMFSVPPFPSTPSPQANLLIVNADTLTDNLAPLAYPGLSVVPPNAWLSLIGDSNNPAGFGLDSSGQVTMFLADAAGTIHLEVTSDGSNWTPIGSPVTYDPTFAPSNSLSFAEAGGTYLVQGVAPSSSGKAWQVVRPAANVEVPLLGRGQIARDGGCVAALASSTELDVVNATNGQLTKIALPFSIDSNAWVSTWIPGDDAVLPATW